MHHARVKRHNIPYSKIALQLQCVIFINYMRGMLYGFLVILYQLLTSLHT